MRKVTVLALMLAAAGAVPAYGAHGGPATATATQHSVNQSGANGRISFVAVGEGTSATGTATGLQPSVGRYVTLVYDVGSVPGGPTVCEPTVEMDGMFVGFWEVGPDGGGNLVQAVPPAAVAPIGTFDTVSIRDTTINQGFGPEAVVACGQVSDHPPADAHRRDLVRVDRATRTRPLLARAAELASRRGLT